MENIDIWDLINIDNKETLKNKSFYISADNTDKWQITTNYNLLKISEWKIHFNNPKLEVVIWYTKKDKNPIGIYQTIIDENFLIKENLLPKSLEDFLWLTDLYNIQSNQSNTKTEDIENTYDSSEDDLPF